ncbi:MAG: response regulator transcription factor, partial [Actinobacteria bacterium]|nr:response regulator transcription factor [Actinomycetota bacterium]
MTDPSPALRVLVADDDDLLRDVLADVFTDDGRLEVIAAVGDAEAAVRAAQQHRPPLALVDVRMPGGGGARVARELRTLSPGTRVVALSSHDDRASIAEMFRAGAVSYLVKGEATNRDIVSTLLR